MVMALAEVMAKQDAILGLLTRLAQKEGVAWENEEELMRACEKRLSLLLQDLPPAPSECADMFAKTLHVLDREKRSGV